MAREKKPLIEEVKNEVDAGILIEMYHRMLTIRQFEETVFDVYRRGWMPGLAHLSDAPETRKLETRNTGTQVQTA